MRRNRELQAKHDEVLRQKYAAKSNTKRGKNGIMPSMKNRAKSALALTLAIAGGLASPLRADASATISSTPPSKQLRSQRAQPWRFCGASMDSALLAHV